MLAYSITSVTGWVLMVLLIATIIYPFLLRSGFLGPVQPFLKRMRFHYWLGYSIAGIMVVHLWIPMSAGLAGRVNAAGLYLATVAMILIFVQVSLGRRLSWPNLTMRKVVRRWHFWVMIGIVVSTVAQFVEQIWTGVVPAALDQSGLPAFLLYSGRLLRQVMSARAHRLERAPVGPAIAPPPSRVCSSAYGPGLPVFAGVSL